MSRWDKHRIKMDGTGDESHIGEKVDQMEVLDEGDGENFTSLYLRCPNDGREFWFDDKPEGRNAVKRTCPETGQAEMHAKCPGCLCEWDGDIGNPYYAISYTVAASDSLNEILDSVPLGCSISAIIIFDVVRAENALDAIKEMKLPENLPMDRFSTGLTVIATTKEQYDSFHEHKDTRGTEGTLSEMLRKDRSVEALLNER